MNYILISIVLAALSCISGVMAYMELAFVEKPAPLKPSVIEIRPAVIEVDVTDPKTGRFIKVACPVPGCKAPVTVIKSHFTCGNNHRFQEK